MQLRMTFQEFEGAQDVFSRLPAVCFMLLPHNPTDYPSTIRGWSVGPPVAVK
jgi:hypothetical protein